MIRNNWRLDPSIRRFLEEPVSCVSCSPFYHFSRIKQTRHIIGKLSTIDMHFPIILLLAGALNFGSAVAQVCHQAGLVCWLPNWGALKLTFSTHSYEYLTISRPQDSPLVIELSPTPLLELTCSPFPPPRVLSVAPHTRQYRHLSLCWCPIQQDWPALPVPTRQHISRVLRRRSAYFLGVCGRFSRRFLEFWSCWWMGAGRDCACARYHPLSLRRGCEADHVPVVPASKIGSTSRRTLGGQYSAGTGFRYAGGGGSGGVSRA